MATDNGYEYLQGEHQPVTQELDVANLKVTGALPKELDGLYVRNSPNPHFTPPGKYHWFDGDGMVHGLRFGDGQARYVNRWVRTKGFLHEEGLGKAVYGGILDPLTPEAMKLPGGPLKDTANTDLVFHRGKLFATCGAKHGVCEITFGLEPDHAAALVENDPRFKPYSRDKRGVVLDAAKVKRWSEVQELILESYELVKPPKVKKAAKKSTPGKGTRR